MMMTKTVQKMMLILMLLLLLSLMIMQSITLIHRQAAERPVPYVIGARRPGDIDMFFADPRKASELLGWTASRGLDEMCKGLSHDECHIIDSYINMHIYMYRSLALAGQQSIGI